MRGERFRAREKKVQKLGRDGLVEQNKATGEERRVSGRAADISFAPARLPEETQGAETQREERPAGRTEKKRRRQPRSADAVGPAWTSGVDGASSAAWQTPDAPPNTSTDTADAPSMRMAADAPLLSPSDEPEPPPSPPPKRRRRKGRNERKKQQRPEQNAVPRVPRDVPLQTRPATERKGRPPRLSQNSGRLRFDAGEDEGPPPDRNASKQRQARRFAHDAARPAQTEDKIAPLRGPGGTPPLDEKQDRPPRFTADGGRLCFEDDTLPAPAENDAPRRAAQMRRAADFTDAGTRSAHRDGRLRFEDDTRAEAAPPAGPGARAAPAANAATKPERSASPDAGTGPAPSCPREEKQLIKAEKRVEQSVERVEKAQENLPGKRRAHLERGYDPETGKVRRRLRFEREPVPEGAKPALPKRAGGAVVRTAGAAVGMRIHGKVREVEQDNVAVEAAHKGELAAEQGGGKLLRWAKHRLRTRPYRALHRAEQRLAMDRAELAWRTALHDTPALRQQRARAKRWQRKKLRRKYAAAAQKAKKTEQRTRSAANKTGQAVRALAQQILSHKMLFLVIVLLLLIVLLFSAGLTSCTAMLSSVQSSYISASYMADETDISESDLYYTELETDLQIGIDQTEENYPGYDEYRYSIREISHDPYELMGYLSAAFDAFRFSQIRDEIEALFPEQYQHTREEIVETRSDEDDEPYDWHVLQTTLTVRSLGSVIAEKLDPGEQTDRYGIYMQTLGNRQAFGDPFDFPWLGHVSGRYGWRTDGAGAKELHQGIDLAAAQGTPIQAIHAGRVTSVDELDGYGLCVTIEDEQGYEARFAHCDEICVSEGQEVARGDTIATVGGADTDTGPHLHLEVLLDGDYLDPYYFVDTGGGYSGGTGGGAIPGTPGGPVIPDYPGEAPSDETFAAILAEAEKYIGYPYVWGGSSPDTSFDCSGYVSWVIDHSGWNYGRLTAQGLYNVCTPVSSANAKPGDLVFFTRTYSTPDPVTHVGIYIGNNRMLHCGDPIGYADLSDRYWQAHLYAFGRLP